MIKKFPVKTKLDHPVLLGFRVSCYSFGKVDPEISIFKDIIFIGCFSSLTPAPGGPLFIPSTLDLRDVENPVVTNFIFPYTLVPKQDWAIEMKLVPAKIAEK